MQVFNQKQQEDIDEKKIDSAAHLYRFGTGDGGGRNDAAVTPKKEGSPVRASSGLPCFFESVHCKSNLRGGNTPSGHTRAEKPHSPAKRQAWSATQSVSTEKGPLRIATTGREGLFPPGKGEVPLERRDCPRPGNHGKARWGLLTLFAVCWGKSGTRGEPTPKGKLSTFSYFIIYLNCLQKLC